MKKPIYLQTWLIVLCFALWILIVPPVVGIVLLIMQYSYEKKLYIKYNNIEDADKYKKESEKIRGEAEQYRSAALFELEQAQQKYSETLKKAQDEYDSKVSAATEESKSIMDKLKSELKTVEGELESLKNEYTYEITKFDIDDSITSEEYKTKYNL